MQSNKCRISAIDNFTKTFLKFNRGIDKSATRLAKLQTAMNRTMKIARTMFAGMAVSIGLASKSYAKLEERVLEISTLMGKDMPMAVDNFMNRFMSMSNRLPQSAEKLADAFYDIKSALPYVNEVEQLFNVLEISARAAIGGRTDTATAARAIVSILNAFRMEANQAQRVADVLFQTVRLGMVRFEDLAKEMGVVSTMASSVGIKFEDLAAEMATLTKSGLNAAMSATFLRGAYRNFLRPSEQARKAARKMNVELNAQTLQTQGLIGVIRQLKDQGYGVQEIADMFPNVRAIQAVQNLFKSFDEHTITADKMFDAEGMSYMAYERMIGSLSNQFRILANQFRNFSIIFSSLFVGDIRSATESLGAFIMRFQGLSDEQKEWIGDMVMSALKVTGLITLIGLLGKAITFLVNPITVLISVGWLLYKAWQENWFGIRDIVTGVIDTLIEKFNEIKPWLEEKFEWLIEFGGSAWEWLQDFYNEDVKPAIDVTWNWLKGDFWDFIKNTVWEDWMKGKAGPVIKAVWEWGIDYAKGTAEDFKHGLETGDWGPLIDRGKDALTFAVGLTVAAGAVAGLAAKIKAGLVATGLFGPLGAAVALMIGLEISDIMAADDKSAALMDSIVNALGGAAAGFFLGGPTGMMIGLMIGLQFKPLTQLKDWYNEQIKPKIDLGYEKAGIGTKPMIPTEKHEEFRKLQENSFWLKGADPNFQQIDLKQTIINWRDKIFGLTDQTFEEWKRDSRIDPPLKFKDENSWVRKFIDDFGEVIAHLKELIDEQTSKDKGFASGGYTGNGGKFQPAGIVHKGEYVIPQWMVRQNPELISMLEGKRLRGYSDGSGVGFNPTAMLGVPEYESFNWEKVSGKQIVDVFEEGTKNMPDLIADAINSGVNMILESAFVPGEGFEFTDMQKGILTFGQTVLQLFGAFDDMSQEAKEIYAVLTGQKPTRAEDPHSSVIDNFLVEFGRTVKEIFTPETYTDSDKRSGLSEKLLRPINSVIYSLTEMIRGEGQGFNVMDTVGAWMKDTSSAFKDKIKESDLFEPLLERLGPVNDAFSALGDYGITLSKGLTSMISEVSGIKEILHPTQILLQGMMEVIGPLINQALAPLIGILKIVGQALGQMLAPLIKLLARVFEVVAKAFLWIYNNMIVPVINLVVKAFTLFANFIVSAINAVISVLNAVPFVDIGYVDKLNYDELKVNPVDEESMYDEGGANTPGGGTSYSAGGERHITQNFEFKYNGAVFTDDEQSANEFIDWVIDRLDERGTTVVS